jgi:PAS domain S-box-containing protein
MLDQEASWSLSLGEAGQARLASVVAGERAPREEQPIMWIWSYRPQLWLLGSFFAAYVLGGGFAQSLAIVPGTGISIWPNSGLFLATLLASRPQTWPWWILAGCLGELTGNALWFGSPLAAALLIYAGNALEALTGALLINFALGRPVRLATIGQMLTFVVLGAGIGPVVSATIGGATIAHFGLLSQTFTSAWLLLWVGDAAGVLVVTPFALAVLTQWRGDAKYSPSRWIEAATVGFLLVAIAALSLGGVLPFAYVVMPPLLWAAVRFEFRGAAVALIALTLITAMFTITGSSEFSGDPESQRGRHIELQVFLAVSAFSALIMASISRQNQQLLRTLRESERQLRELVSVVPVAIARLDPDGRPSFFNRHLLDFLGLDGPNSAPADKTELASRMAEAIHPDDTTEFDRALAHALETGEPFGSRYRLRRADGDYRWVEQRNQPFRGRDGEIVHWYGVTFDVDDQVRLTTESAEREARIRRLVDSDVIGIVIWDLNGTLIDANDAFLRMVQYERADIEAGMRWFDMTPPDWQEVHAKEEALELAQTGVMQPREKEYFRKDGSRVPVLIGAAAFEDRSNQGVAYILDLTERQRAEATLRDRERELSQLVDMVPSYLWRMTPEGAPAFFNKRLAIFLGFDVGGSERQVIDGLAALIDAVIHPQDAADVAAAFERSFAGAAPMAMKWRMRRADGAYRWMAASAEAMRDQDGRIIQWYGLCHDIDDQVRTEQLLRERELDLTQLVEMAPVHISRMSPTGEPTWYSRRTLEALGIDDIGDWDQPDLSRLTATLRASLHPEDAVQMADTIRHALATGTPYTIRFRRRTREGVYEWREGRADPLRDENGTIIQWNCATIDIDAQMRTEFALRDRERELSHLVDMVPSYLWRMNPNGNPAFFNRRLVEYLGFDVSGPSSPATGGLSDLLEAMIHPEDAQAAARALARSLGSGAPLSMKWRMRRCDGTYRWMAASAEAMRDEDGVIAQWYGLCHDIDDQVQTEDLLRERELELSLLVDMVPVHISRMSASGEPTFYSKRTLASIGISHVGALDEPDMSRLATMLTATVHPDDLEMMRETIGKSISAGEPFYTRYRRRHADGSYRWMEGRAEPLRGENGAILQWYAVAMDVDDQVRAEVALRQSEQRLQEIIDAVPVRIWSTDANGGPVYLNKRYQDHFRAVISHFSDIKEPRLSALLQELVHPDDAPGTRDTLLGCFEKGEGAVLRFRSREPGGVFRWAECRVEPRRDNAGTIVQWYGASVDIDDEVQAQEALLLAQERVARASQAASLAELSASIAHEVNQPLAAVVANSHACQRWLTRQPPNIARAQSTIERIIRDANAAGEVVSRIRALFKQNVDSRSSATIVRAVEEACRLVADISVGSSVTIEVDVDLELPEIPFDQVQIQQVLINLLRNAIDAMDGAPSPRIVRVSARLSNNVVQVEVSDTGNGVREPESIFEAFYTTKENGMGMGLAISRTIVESHGGQMWLKADGRKGATFVFTLPITIPVAA